MFIYFNIFILIILLLNTNIGLSEKVDTSFGNTNNIAESSIDNVLYSELLGNTISLIGLNYERLILNLDTFIINNSLFYFRTGINFNIIPPHISMPFMLNAVLFDENSLELGIGFFYDYVYYKKKQPDEDDAFTPWSNFPVYADDHIKFTFTIGFRHTPNNGGFTFRTGYTPIIFKNGNFWHMWGFSFGHSW